MPWQALHFRELFIPIQYASLATAVGHRKDTASRRLIASWTSVANAGILGLLSMAVFLSPDHCVSSAALPRSACCAAFLKPPEFHQDDTLDGYMLVKGLAFTELTLLLCSFFILQPLPRLLSPSCQPNSTNS